MRYYDIIDIITINDGKIIKAELSDIFCIYILDKIPFKFTGNIDIKYQHTHTTAISDLRINYEEIPYPENVKINWN